MPTLRPALAAAAVVAALALAAAGCDLFRPATPETAAGGTAIRVDLSHPDSTLATLARAVAKKADGLDAYLQTLADPVVDGVAFNATFDAAVAGQFPSVPETWSNALERDFFGRFTSKWPEAYAVRWDPDERFADDPTSDPPVRFRHYEVYRILDTDPPDSARVAVGYVKLTYRLTSGRYVIRTWEDSVDPAIGVNPAVDDDRSLSYRRLQQ